MTARQMRGTIFAFWLIAGIGLLYGVIGKGGLMVVGLLMCAVALAFTLVAVYFSLQRGPVSFYRQFSMNGISSLLLVVVFILLGVLAAEVEQQGLVCALAMIAGIAVVFGCYWGHALSPYGVMPTTRRTSGKSSGSSQLSQPWGRLLARG